MQASMFERYGGFVSVSRVVSAFYDKALDSPILSPYFTNANMQRIIDHQTKFVASLMGGPASYSNEELIRVHKGLSINEEAFLEMTDLFTETLEDFDFDEDDVKAVEKELNDRKLYVVTYS
jgi:hemoglobin